MTAPSPLLEPSPYEADGGNLIGRDPRKITADEFAAYLPSTVIGMKAIRAKCLDCAGGSFGEVRKCTAWRCPLWALRMGVQPKGLRAARAAQVDDDSDEESLQ